MAGSQGVEVSGDGESTAGQHLSSSMREDRVFAPPSEFAARAHIGSLSEYDAMYRQSVEEPETFWATAAAELDWITPWTTVLDWQLPVARWFDGGRLNLCANAVDRHALGARAGKTALLWEGEPGEVRSLTYAELHADVQKFANGLKSLGVAKGDRVAIYMGMCPELAIALLACARIGAAHSVIFGGFAAQAIADRANDAQCKVLITQDTSYRRGADVPLKAIADEALTRCACVKNVVVFRRSGKPVQMVEGRDHWWHELVADVDAVCAPEAMEAEDPLFCCTPAAQPASRKGWYTPPAAMVWERT